MIKSVQALTGGAAVDTYVSSPAEIKQPRLAVITEQAVSSSLPETAAVDFERMKESVQAALSEIIEVAEKSQTKVSFSVSDATNRVVIRVENAQTGELIREVPPEKLLADPVGVLFNGLA